MNEHILIVDDERELAELVSLYLTNAGFRTSVCTDGASALALVRRETPDLALLDVMLPDMSGFDICREIRKTHFFPIIMLTAKIEDNDKILGLTLGADDYITKPVSIREVLARVKSVLRRTAQREEEPETLDYGPLHMDLRSKTSTLEGEELRLTKKEFEILALLLSHPGVIFSREEILHRVWSDEVIVLDRTIDVNITRLRRKIGACGEHIVTRPGYGYGFEM